MPQISTPDGRVVYVPGVYQDTEVISDQPGPTPAFQIPVILASADFGRPYNYESLKVDTLEPTVGAGGFVLCGTPSEVARRFGRGSDAHVASQFAWRHGLPFSFVVSLSALTRYQVVITSGAQVVDEVNLYPKDFGALPGHILAQVSGGTARFTPVKRYTPVTQAATIADVRLYVRDNSWINLNQEVTIGRQGAANVTRTVVNKGQEIAADGRPIYWIEVSAAPAFTMTPGTDYPYVLVYDTSNPETYSYTNLDDLTDAINNNAGSMLVAERAGTFSGAAPDALATATALKDIAAWGTVTDGDSPAATPTDVTAFIAQMNASDWEGFAARYQLLPQSYMLAMPEEAAHLSMRDYAIAERTRGFPISVMSGGNWGDIVIDAGDTTDPIFRLGNLNSQDFALAVGGMDDEPAYRSLAAAAFGLRVRGGPGHNLTQDELVFSKLEVRWNQIGALELDRLHRAGALTYRMAHYTPFPYVISQGLNTLQSNAGPIWDEVTSETWSITQRDLGDFIDRVLSEDINRTQLGANGVDARSIQAVLRRRGEDLGNRGFIEAGSHQIVSVKVNAANNGFDVVQRFRLPTTTDYITITNQILITG